MDRSEGDPGFKSFEDHEPLRRLGRDRSRFNIVMLLTRTGACLFAAELERRYFPPGTKRNEDLVTFLSNWEGMPWAIVSIPARLRRFAERVAERTGMRLADGVPTIFEAADPPVNYVGSTRTSRSGPSGEFQVKRFPLDSDNTFTLENAKNSDVYRGGAAGLRAWEEREPRRIFGKRRRN